MIVDVYILNLLVIGLLFLVVTLGSGWVSRLPLSFALIYLIVGIILGPNGWGLIQLRRDEIFNATFLEHITELVILISVFSCGLKIRLPIQFRVWNITARLIFFLMPFSIFLLAFICKFVLNMTWGEAILLGAILSPTDPVLASEVQLSDLNDEDELRFGLTSEGGLNDALAFPFVYFGLYALKDDNWSNWFISWVLVDVFWAILAGLVMGVIVPKLILWMEGKTQKRRQINELVRDFIAISTILLTYSLTEVVNGYGFLAVFVAGIIVHNSHSNQDHVLTQLSFVEQIEKLLEIGVIVLLGSILLWQPMLKYASESFWVIISLFIFIRPLGVWIATFNSKVSKSPHRKLSPITRFLFGWFGIRGVGSLYYLAYAFSHDLKGESGELIGWVTYTTIVVSAIIHGVSATPLMNWYNRRIGENQLLED